MGRTRFTSGGVTVTLTHDLEAWARRRVEAAGRGIVRVLEGEAEAVASAASSRWYELVDRKTGATGQIDVTTTIGDTEVRVAVGSTDQRRAGGRPVPVFVRQPGPLSTRMVEIGAEEWGRRKQAGLTVGKIIGWAPMPRPKRATSPKFLLEMLVRTPMRLRVRESLGRMRREAING